MLKKSVHGEDVPYLLGIPLDGRKFHFQNNYNLPEKLLSEVVMTMWSNFAKTGDPNIIRKYNYLTLNTRDWKHYDLKWPLFEPFHQAYLSIDTPPQIGYKYRDHALRLWSEVLPKVLSNPGQTDTPRQRYPVMSRVPQWVPEDPRSYPDAWPFPPRHPRPTSKPSYGVMKFSNEETVKHQPKEDDSHMDSPKPTEPEAEQINNASSFSFNLLIILGVCFLIVNVISFIFICYQKQKLRKQIQDRYRDGSTPSLPGINDPYRKRSEKVEMKSILKSSEGSNEHLKPKSERLGRWPGMYRQGSSSTVTMDPHTKVTEWIAQEMEQGSPRSLRRPKGRAEFDRVSTATTSRIPTRGGLKKVKKVSVAVDATPSTRSESVLKQIPIELTKSMDNGTSRLGGHPGRPMLQRSVALEGEEEIKSGHSYSDIAHIDQSPESEKPLPSHGLDINVTCRDEEPPPPLTPEEALDNIKRRNFPKVLPDFPEASEDDDRSNFYSKRMSMPSSMSEQRKVPPPPPPRVSTLGRRGPHRNTVPNFMTAYQKEPEKPQKRPEPKVIIKPTISTDPKSKKNPQIPRVTHQPIEADYAEIPCVHTSPSIPPLDAIPDTKGGMDAPMKIKPVKKSSSADTSESSVSSNETVKENKITPKENKEDDIKPE